MLADAALSDTSLYLLLLLQRFVRLHGMLFSELSNQELSPSLPFSVPDFLGMLDTALADLRQLLKMSAFGDGLLLHMVIICIYSAITANDQGSSIHQQDDTAIEVRQAGRQTPGTFSRLRSQNWLHSLGPPVRQLIGGGQGELTMLVGPVVLLWLLVVGWCRRTRCRACR